MASAKQVIDQAMKLILVQGSNFALDPEEYEDAIFQMNNLMLALDADGVRLGYTSVSSINDDITIPDGAIRGLVANLAIEMAPGYNAPISAGLSNAAQSGAEVMRKLGTTLQPSKIPGGFPYGTTNTAYNNSYGTNQFPYRQNEILAETAGTIGLEDNTEEQSS